VPLVIDVAAVPPVAVLAVVLDASFFFGCGCLCVPVYTGEDLGAGVEAEAGEEGMASAGAL
jgi:hypothetical protein